MYRYRDTQGRKKAQKFYKALLGKKERIPVQRKEYHVGNTRTTTKFERYRRIDHSLEKKYRKGIGRLLGYDMEKKEKKRTRSVLRKQRGVEGKQQQNDKQNLFCLDVGLVPRVLRKEGKAKPFVSVKKIYRDLFARTHCEGLGRKENNDNHYWI